MFGNNQTTMARRYFMNRLGLGGASILGAAAVLGNPVKVKAGSKNTKPSRGDVAILRLLAAAEILESDLWQQYKEVALGNVSYLQALQAMDGDMPTYVNQNTRDEFSHADFINKYMESKGIPSVSLEPFRRLPSSQATGSNKTAKRLTNLMNLTVDTSWFNRYRSFPTPGNPDFGDVFAQIVNLVDLPAIPNTDLPLPTDPTNGFKIQLIANTAGFHFATIEQGGSSLYESFLTKVTSLEVLRIVGSIGGTEIMHFELWQDKAGNAPSVTDPNTGAQLFPTLPTAPSVNGVTAFPGDGTDPDANTNDTNQVMPVPCKFISDDLPLCSVIRPTSTAQAGAVTAFKGFADSGLFAGQNDDFFDFVFSLAAEADEAVREC